MSDDGLLCTITAFLIALFFFIFVDKVFIHFMPSAEVFSHTDNNAVAVEDFFMMIKKKEILFIIYLYNTRVLILPRCH